MAVEKTGLASLSTPAWQTDFSTSGKKKKKKEKSLKTISKARLAEQRAHISPSSPAAGAVRAACASQEGFFLPSPRHEAGALNEGDGRGAGEGERDIFCFFS